MSWIVKERPEKIALGPDRFENGITRYLSDEGDNQIVINGYIGDDIRVNCSVKGPHEGYNVELWISFSIKRGVVHCRIHNEGLLMMPEGSEFVVGKDDAEMRLAATHVSEALVCRPEFFRIGALANLKVSTSTFHIEAL